MAEKTPPAAETELTLRELLEKGIKLPSKFELSMRSKLYRETEIPSENEFAISLEKNIQETHPFKQFAETLQTQMFEQNLPKDFLTSNASASTVLLQTPTSRELERNPLLPDLFLSARNLPKSALNFWQTMFYGLPAFVIRSSYQAGAHGEKLLEALGKYSVTKSTAALKEELSKMEGNLTVLGEGLLEANRPWIELFKRGNVRALSRYIEKDPAFFLFDSAALLSAAGKLTQGTGSLTRAMGKVSKVSAIEKSGEIIRQVGQAMNVPDVLKMTRDSLLALPTEDLTKIPIGGKIFSPVEKLQKKAKQAIVTKRLIKLLESDSWIQDKADIANQYAIGSKVFNAFNKLKPSQIDQVVAALEGTALKVSEGEGYKVIGRMEDVLKQFTPEMREAYNLQRSLSLINEDFLKTHSYLSDHALEIRRYKPVMSKLGINLEQAKRLFPADHSPVYWEHTWEKATWKDFVGIGTPARVMGIKAVSREATGFLERMKGSPNYITDNVPIITMAAMRRIRTQNMIRKIFDFSKKYGVQLLPEEELKPGYVSFNPNLLTRQLLNVIDDGDRVIRVLDEGALHNFEVLTKAGRHSWQKYVANLKAPLLEHWWMDTVQVPKKLAERFLHETGIEQFERTRVGKATTGFLKYTFMPFKLGWLTFNLKYYVGNMFSNISFALTSGVRPKFVRMALDDKIKTLIPSPLLGSLSSADQKVVLRFAKHTSPVPEMVERFVEAANGEAGKALAMAKKMTFNPVEWGRHVDRFFDERSRAPVYLTNLNRELRRENLLGLGKKWQKLDEALIALNTEAAPDVLIAASRRAMDATFDFFADYVRLSPLEKWFGKTGFFTFYPWLKFVNKLAFTFPAKYPLRAQLLKQLSLINWLAADEDLKQWGIPRETLPIYVAGDVIVGQDQMTGEAITIDAQFLNPFGSVFALNENIPLHPLATSFIRSWFGIDPFTGKRVGLRGIYPTYIVPFTGEVWRFDHEGKPVEISKTEAFVYRLLETLYKSMPQSKVIDGLLLEGARFYPGIMPFLNLDGLLNPYTGAPRDERTFLGAASRFFGYPVTKQDLMSYLKGEHMTREQVINGLIKHYLKGLQIKSIMEEIEKMEKKK